MARSVNQTVAWVIAFFLSTIVFIGVIGLVFMMGPKQNNQDHAGENPSADHSPASQTPEQGASTSDATDQRDSPAPETPNPGAGPDAETPAAQAPGGEEEEISADSFKKPKP